MDKLNYGSFNSLITSHKGIHLSAYIKNNQDIQSIKDKLKETIIHSSYHLQNALTPDEMMKFLKPIEMLSEDHKTLGFLKENIAIFRTKSLFKILAIPTSFKEICVVADTFHVKPLLKWLQNDNRFMIMGVTRNYINLYRASTDNPPSLMTTVRGSESEIQDFLHHRADLWFKEILEDHPRLQGQDLYVVTSPELGEQVMDSLCYDYKNLFSKYQKFNHSYVNKMSVSIDLLRRNKKQQDYVQSIKEYYVAEDQNLAQNNIYDIAKSAIEGKIKKLIIRDGINVFGKICQDSGDLAIHHTELNHEDDDLLDDLAQTVLLHGGEVMITDEEQLPEHFPVAAILEHDHDAAPSYKVKPTYISSNYLEGL